MTGTKFFEVRDRMTRILVFATHIIPAGMNESELWMWRTEGWDGVDAVTFLYRVNGKETHYEPHRWGAHARTMPEAHRYIHENWDSLVSGGLIDVRVILGEEDEPAETDRLYDADKHMPWCPHCRASTKSECKCGPIAEND